MLHIKKEEQLISNWSGGTTREIYIFPNGSDYSKREFDFRLSTATVDCEESTFTPLPSIHRHLMILEGKLTITHEDQYQKELRPYEQDEFEGEWNTSSIGKVIDFNLIIKKGKGELAPYDSTKQLIPNFPNDGFSKYFLYIHSGSLQCNQIVINAGDIVIWDKTANHIVINELQSALGVYGFWGIDR